MKQTNTGLIVKAKLDVPFVQIPNKVLRDGNLSLKAKGLLSLLLSLPADWAVYKTQLASFSKDGRDATIAAFDELMDVGYIIGVRRHNEKGQFSGYDYVVYNEPATPFPENPKTDKPKTDNPPLQIKTVQIQNLQTKNITNILGKAELISKICIGMNITTKQLNDFISDNFSEFWNQKLIKEYQPLIEQYKQLKQTV
jgi:hypothetical protein